MNHKLTLESMEDILKSKTKCQSLYLIIYGGAGMRKWSMIHEENDSFAFCCNADISDDARTGAGAGTK